MAKVINSLSTAVRFTPLGDRILVKPADEETKTASGLYIAESAQEKPQHGTVLAVGPGKYERGQLLPMYCKKGNKIAFGKYAGSPIKIDGEELLILKEEEVFGILD